MAGFPIKRQVAALIDEHFGGPEGLLEFIGDGGTLTEACDRMGLTRSRLTNNIRKIVPDWRARMAEAQQARAEAYAEEALDIADAPMPDAASVGRARLRIETRKWLAAVDDPSRFGKTEAMVQVNIGSLHLDALRKVGHLPAQDHAAETRVIDYAAGEGEV